MNSNRYFIWNKGDNIKLSNYFTSDEFDCKCTHKSCVEQRISIDIIEKLDIIRKDVGAACVITSGFRCQKHQEDIRNSGVSTVVAKKSTHESGDAVDVKFPERFDQEAFEKICSPQFESVGLAKSFLHLDLRKGHRRWNY